MKKKIFFSLLGVMLLLIPGALWANNQPGVPQDTPAILVSLGQANAIPLDDTAAAAVRGQADYVLVKVFLLNMFDYGPGVKWTWNPLGYRYGNYGGYNFGAGSPVDDMDICFMNHDNGTAPTLAALLGQPGLTNDQALVALLTFLPNTPDGYWGSVYTATLNGTPITLADAPPYVNVFGFSLIGGKIFRSPQPMPYTEYSRREAMYGMQLLILGKKVIGL